MSNTRRPRTRTAARPTTRRPSARARAAATEAPGRPKAVKSVDFAGTAILLPDEMSGDFLFDLADAGSMDSNPAVMMQITRGIVGTEEYERMKLIASARRFTFTEVAALMATFLGDCFVAYGVTEGE